MQVCGTVLDKETGSVDGWELSQQVNRSNADKLTATSSPQAMGCTRSAAQPALTMKRRLLPARPLAAAPWGPTELHGGLDCSEPAAATVTAAAAACLFCHLLTPSGRKASPGRGGSLSACAVCIFSSARNPCNRSFRACWVGGLAAVADWDNGTDAHHLCLCAVTQRPADSLQQAHTTARRERNT